MEYQEPSKEQLKLMQDYSDILSKAIEIIMQCDGTASIALQHASARAQESMHWFHTYVINGGKLKENTEKH